MSGTDEHITDYGGANSPPGRTECDSQLQHGSVEIQQV